MELCGHSSIFCKFEFKYYLHFCDQSDGKSVTIESVFCVEFKAWSVSIFKCNLWWLKAFCVSNSKPDPCQFLIVICDDLKEWRHPPRQLRVTHCVSCHVIDDVRCHAIKDVSSHVSIHVIADVICQRGTRHQDAGKRPVMMRKRVYLWRNRFVTKHRRR